MASLGQELKRERELRGITLEEISESTKIGMKFLQALEEDKLEVMPNKFFIKAVLRTYAKFLGLEEHSVLNRYHEISILQEQSQQAEKQIIEKKEETSKNEKIWTIAVIVGVPLLILLCWIFLFSPKKKTHLPPESPNPSISLPQEAPILPPLSQTEALVESKPEEKGLTLEIIFSEETWLQVYGDGQLKLEGIKKPGEKALIQARQELLLHLGNAGGISFRLNDKEGKPLGSSGAVLKNIRINLENYKNFLVGEKESLNSPRQLP